jgi:ribose 5-phosphate isomerase RpiB
VLVFVLTHLVNEVAKGQIERTVLVFAIGLGPVGVTGAHQGDLHTVAADQSFARMMPAHRDMKILRLGIELGDLGDLVVYVTPKTIGNFNVTSNDVQFHGDLL